jgi:hypothetical protein
VLPRILSKVSFYNLYPPCIGNKTVFVLKRRKIYYDVASFQPYRKIFEVAITSALCIPALLVPFIFN